MLIFHPMLAGDCISPDTLLVILDRGKMTREEMLIGDWEKLIGYRVLVKIANAVGDFMVNRIAPKSGYVELRPKGWYHVDDIELLEVLG